VYRRATIILSIAMVVLGLAMLVLGLAAGGNVGPIFGVLFVAAGVGRLWVARQSVRR
jgi:hypothetical protein